MTEIDKMFENAGIKPLCQIPDKFCGVQNIYEDFAVEKQLELIKWLIRNKRLFIRKADYSSNYYMDVTYNRGNGVDNPEFEICLASLINDIWQSLTNQEKDEIRNILNA